MTQKIHAWHFLGATLRNGDPIPKDNVWLEFKGSIVMCQSGLHASKEPWDALQYAPGDVLSYVLCEDIREEQKDKLVCSRRMILQRKNVEDVCRKFARQQALSVIHLWSAPQVVKDYLTTGDKKLRAAVREAAREAAWDAALDAARAAAWDAAWDGAWEAAREAARRDFNTLIYKEFGV